MQKLFICFRFVLPLRRFFAFAGLRRARLQAVRHTVQLGHRSDGPGSRDTGRECATDRPGNPARRVHRTDRDSEHRGGLARLAAGSRHPERPPAADPHRQSGRPASSRWCLDRPLPVLPARLPASPACHDNRRDTPPGQFAYRRCWAYPDLPAGSSWQSSSRSCRERHGQWPEKGN